MNVALGGTLHQHVPADVPGAIATASDVRRGAPRLRRRRDRGSRRSSPRAPRVNSHHHQAIDRCAARWTVSARAPDGVVEGAEAPAIPSSSPSSGTPSEWTAPTRRAGCSRRSSTAPAPAAQRGRRGQRGDGTGLARAEVPDGRARAGVLRRGGRRGYHWSHSKAAERTCDQDHPDDADGDGIVFVVGAVTWVALGGLKGRPDDPARASPDAEPRAEMGPSDGRTPGGAAAPVGEDDPVNSGQTEPQEPSGSVKPGLRAPSGEDLSNPTAVQKKIREILADENPRWGLDRGPPRPFLSGPLDADVKKAIEKELVEGTPRARFRPTSESATRRSWETCSASSTTPRPTFTTRPTSSARSP